MTVRNRSLDGLRGIAVVSVVLHHYLRAKLLWAGVDLFFVLSGFLITSILLRTKEKTFGPYIGEFYAKRVRRILPPYLMLLLVATVVLGAGWMAHGWLYFGLMNFAYPLHVPIPPQLEILWSLAVEEQFYLLWPVAVFFLSRQYLQRVTIALLIVAPLARYVCSPYFDQQWTIYSLLPFRMDTLAAGALAALYRPQIETACRRIKHFHWIWAGSAVFALAVFSLLNRHGITTSSNTPVSNAFVYECTLLMVFSLFMMALSGAVPRLFGLAPFVWMGTISYSVYLIHEVTQYYFKHLAVAFVATLAYAIVMWFAIEKPLTRRPATE